MEVFPDSIEDLRKQLDERSLELEQVKRKLEFDASLEAALERVRSFSLNMTKSEELFDVIQLIIEQFFILKMDVEGSAIALNPDSNDLEAWTAVPGASYPFKFVIPYFDHASYNIPLEAKKKGADYVSYCLTFEEKNQWLDHVYKHLHGVREERKKQNYSTPGISSASAFRKNFNLNIYNYSGVPYSAKDLEVLQRFANAFDQAYSRFLDLQKAESNAREAVKSASLDRVRAQTASMRSTADLQRIIPLIWNELTTLGVHFVRCGIFIMDEENDQIHTFLSTPDGKAIASFHTPFSNPGFLTEALPYWQKKEIYKTQWDEAAFLKQARTLMEQGAISSMESYLTDKPPTHLHLHFLPFLQGMLYVGDVAPLNDEQLRLAQDLADAFSNAYARYEDFIRLELAKAQIEKRNLEIAEEKKKSDDLLLNILPEETAHELKNQGFATTRSYEKVSILFSDFVSFTRVSETMTPEELVKELNECFSAFDEIIEREGVEKIKTIGDAYMCASGLNLGARHSEESIVNVGMAIRDFMKERNVSRMKKGLPYFQIRIGIHTGPVVAGVVGKKKFAYDIWGDTVNTASRMETSSEPGELNISGTTYEMVKDVFECEYRGKIEAKNKGKLEMYFVRCAVKM